MARKKATDVVVPTTDTGEIVVDIFAPPAPPVSASQAVGIDTYVSVLPVEDNGLASRPWVYRAGVIATGVLVVVAIIGVLL